MSCDAVYQVVFTHSLKAISSSQVKVEEAKRANKEQNLALTKDCRFSVGLVFCPPALPPAHRPSSALLLSRSSVTCCHLGHSLGYF